MNDNQRIYTGKTETNDKFQLNLIEKKKPFSIQKRASLVWLNLLTNVAVFDFTSLIIGNKIFQLVYINPFGYNFFVFIHQV